MLLSRNYRWLVVALLFFATMINYLDRQVIGLLKDELSETFKWTETDYSYIVMAFSAAYAIGLLLFGRMIDRVGTKIGYAICVIIWSAAAMFHALATGTWGFAMSRTALGLGEAGNFPAAIKAVAEWFPQKDRALATGIFNSGSNMAAIIGPPLVAWISFSFGWQYAFIATGAIGFLWLILWMLFFQVPAKHKKITNWEYEYVHSDSKTAEELISPRMNWWRILRIRQTWAFIAGKFLTDPVWWFYLFWVPAYFNSTFSLDLNKSAKYVSAIYILAGFGSIFGGYLSGWFIRRGYTVHRARKTAMLIFAFSVVPIVLVQFVHQAWYAVALISLAAAAHQAWSANIFTVASDVFPKNAVSSVIGIGGMAGSIGGILFPLFVGQVLDHFKQSGSLHVGYNIIFIVCSCAYLLAWALMNWLAPGMKQVTGVEEKYKSN
jgi:ACS family hexuronate transporter-like MFS transporter